MREQTLPCLEVAPQLLKLLQPLAAVLVALDNGVCPRAAERSLQSSCDGTASFHCNNSRTTMRQLHAIDRVRRQKLEWLTSNLAMPATTLLGCCLSHFSCSCSGARATSICSSSTAASSLSSLAVATDDAVVSAARACSSAVRSRCSSVTSCCWNCHMLVRWSSCA